MVRLFHGVMYHACAPDGCPQLHDASTPDHEPPHKWAIALTWQDPALPRSKLQRTLCFAAPEALPQWTGSLKRKRMFI